MKKEYPKEFVRPTKNEQVVFKDGMIVTAEDLQAASAYPLGVFQTLIRAFFGCGIVCGLNVEIIPGSTACEQNGKKKNVWSVNVLSGIALDCQGFPLELCKPVVIDLTPDPCSCDEPPTCVCIAIRRYDEKEPEVKANCKDGESGQGSDCTRKTEQVMVKVFEIDAAKKLKLPDNTCMRPLDDPKTQGKPKDGKSTTLDDFCNCSKACPDHNCCCGDSWVLLACIEMGECGIECIDNSRRKYVKPIGCLCPAEKRVCLYEASGEGTSDTDGPTVESPSPKAEIVR